jgi:hypothetical protein
VSESKTTPEPMAQDFLEHVVRAASQYDGMCREMAAEILQHRAAGDANRRRLLLLDEIRSWIEDVRHDECGDGCRACAFMARADALAKEPR